MAKGHSDKLASSLEGVAMGKGEGGRTPKGVKDKNRDSQVPFLLLRGRVQTPANDIMLHIAAKFLCGAAAPAGADVFWK